MYLFEDDPYVNSTARRSGPREDPATRDMMTGRVQSSAQLFHAVHKAWHRLCSDLVLVSVPPVTFPYRGWGHTRPAALYLKLYAWTAVTGCLVTSHPDLRPDNQWCNDCTRRLGIRVSGSDRNLQGADRSQQRGIARGVGTWEGGPRLTADCLWRHAGRCLEMVFFFPFSRIRSWDGDFLHKLVS